jgi:hypothetical protein
LDNQASATAATTKRALVSSKLDLFCVSLSLFSCFEIQKANYLTRIQ